MQLVAKNKVKKASARKPDLSNESASASQLKWLARGLTQAGGKLPLFDENGQRINERTVLSCLEKGWAKPWFKNPIKPDWQICGLTKSGRKLLSDN